MVKDLRATGTAKKLVHNYFEESIMYNIQLSNHRDFHCISKLLFQAIEPWPVL